MATVDLTNKAAKPANGLDKFYLLKGVLDFAAHPVAASDVVQALSIPAHTLVKGLYWRVLTAEGATCTATIGDGSDPDGFGAAVNLNSTSTESWSTLALTEGTPNTVTGYTSGKLYTAADTIDLVMGHATDAAKIELKALCVDLS